MQYVGLSLLLVLSFTKRFFSRKLLKKRVQHFQIQIQPGMVDEEPLCGSATLNCYFIFIHYLNQFFYFMLTPDPQRKY